MDRVLVVGGAGYIGGIMTHLLMRKGFEVQVLDNLSTGHQWVIPPEVLTIGDMGERHLLEELFDRFRPDCVMHLAANSIVSESFQKPLEYHHNNVSKTLLLLKVMMKKGCRYIIFSSSAAVYGSDNPVPLREEYSLRPISPYGNTKLIVEHVLTHFSQVYGLKFVSLRYFNAAGAFLDIPIGEAHEPETHLIPNILAVIYGRQDNLKVYGTSYPTPDGTCIRDYIHVLDLADAHIRALGYLLDGGPSEVINLGGERGFSVLEVIDAAKRVCGKEVPVQESAPRPGDPPILICSSEKARRLLGWYPSQSQLEQIIHSAATWYRMHFL
jgi:UDP-glucose 4-epimerase